jgi:hypothetical protein
LAEPTEIKKSHASGSLLRIFGWDKFIKEYFRQGIFLHVEFFLSKICISAKKLNKACPKVKSCFLEQIHIWCKKNLVCVMI